MARYSSVREGQGRTWAKAILLGEHSVVYGHPAVSQPQTGEQQQKPHNPERIDSFAYTYLGTP